MKNEYEICKKTQTLKIDKYKRIAHLSKKKSMGRINDLQYTRMDRRDVYFSHKGIV